MKKQLFAVVTLTGLLLCGCAQKQQLPVVADPVPTVNMVSYHEQGLTDQQILAQRRDIVEAEMRRMMGLLWTPAEDITYTHNQNPLTLKAGRIYRGMPYSHGSGSGFSFLQYATGQDEQGVYTISIDGKMMTGEPNVQACISNDCADALFWAWAKVSTSISFPYTNRMNHYTGVLPVGEYDWPDAKEFGGSTRPITEGNGKETMFRCYAQLQKGDGLVLYTKSSGGHAVMVCEAVVVMNGDQIDGENSYLRILEQESIGLAEEQTYQDETLDKTVYIACGYDETWSFDTVYKKGYLPITCKELIDPSALAEQTVTDSLSQRDPDTMYRGTLECPYRISSVTYTVYDADQRPVQQVTCFVREKEMFCFEMHHFNNPLDEPYRQGSLDLESLPKGSYTCVLTCQISTGSILQLQSFPIDK